MKSPKKISSILALLILAVAGTILTYFTSSSRLFFSKASSSTDKCRPLNPQITNLTHTSVDISFTTASACTSSLGLADKSYPNYQNNSFSHYFSIFSLEPQTDYSYSLILNGQQYSSESYKFTTSAQPSGDTPISNLAWGRVKNSDDSPAKNSIIYLNIPGAAPLSALVTDSGNWNISLATSLNYNQTAWFTPPANIPEEIVVISPNDIYTLVTGNTSLNNPVPDIIIGQNQTDPLALPDTGEIDPLVTAFPSVELEISNPKNNDTVFTQKPQFFGQAPSGSQVIITLHSDDLFEGQVLVDDQGNWLWTPPQDISLGEHEITAKVQDPQTGLWQTVSHKFTVYANDDDQLAFSSSSSANLSTPTPDISDQPTPMPTSIPTITITPTATSAPTSTPQIVNPATDSGVPVTGVGFPTYILIFFASIFTLFSYSLIKHNQD